MRKRSLTVLLITTLGAALLFAVVGFYLRDLRTEYDAITNRHVERLLVILGQMKRAQAEVSDPDQLSKILLRNAIESRDIDFYVVRNNGTVVDSAKVGDLSPGQLKSLDILNEIQLHEVVVFGSVKVGADTISIGFNRSWPEFRRLALTNLSKNALLDILIVLVLVGGLLTYFLRDLKRLLKRFEMSTRTPLAEIKVVSAESEQLKKTIEGFETQVKTLQAAQERFNKMLFSAVEREMKSGRTPPYDFGCTLVRTDLNGFSEMRKRLPVDIFEQMTDDLFLNSMEVVSRYGGYLCEFLGDEIIYYFKDEDSEESVHHALACVWALNRLVEEKELEWRSRSQTDLRFKSSLSVGALSVRSATRSFEFSGFPLIESVRLLGQVDERSESIVVGTTEASQRAAGYCAHRFYKSADLRGIGVKSIERFLETPRVEEILARSQWPLLRFYRTENDVLQQLRWLRRCYLEDAAIAINAGQNIFRILIQSTNSGFGSHRIADEIVLHLRSFQEFPSLGSIFPPLLTLVGRLVLPRSASPELCSQLTKLVKHQDPRVRANAIEALGRLRLSLGGARPTATDHNRVLANFILAKALVDVSESEYQLLSGMLKSADPFHSASGLFAVGELGQYHLNRDPIYFQANPYISKLLTQAIALLNHENEMVRRQCLRMAAKIKVDWINSEISKHRKNLAETGQPQKLSELEQFYDSWIEDNCMPVYLAS